MFESRTPEMYAIQKNSPAMSLLAQPCDSCLPEVKTACAAGATKRMTAKSTARFMVQVDRKNWVMMAALVIPRFFAAGHITGPPSLGAAGGKVQTTVPVRFETFVAHRSLSTRPKAERD